jgi:hypothetical protein
MRFVITNSLQTNADYRLQLFLSRQFKFVIPPNVMVEWLNFQLPVRKVPGPNIGPKTGYSVDFRGFPPSLHANSGIAP